MQKKDLSLVKNILKNHQLHVTSNRVYVLHYLLYQQQAVNKLNVEKHFAHIDTVTIYRMLLIFVEKGILHTINNDKGDILYAVCKNDCTPEKHFHNHIHFSCTICKKTFCLENVHIPEVPLPYKYIKKNVEIHITGICNHCSKNTI
ncbi:MAG: Fur family transcriptional regulator [Chitinophagaceae bacterium]